MEPFESVGFFKTQTGFDEAKLDECMNGIEAVREKGTWSKEEIV
tara:strand:- start:333 stop:464 length:132 start_codon:yes stop_codon:yes gene_type:complete